MGADSNGNARGMSRATKVKLADDESTEGQTWAGIPSLSMQQLWFSLQRREWSTLVAIPADRETSVMDFGRPLYEVGRLAMGEKLRLLDAREVKLTRTAPLILDMTGGSPTRGPGIESGERVLVLIQSVLSHPSGVPVALAADAALLCIELGMTSIAAARETMEIVGRQRFLGCIALPPA
jgi:hypothetical protein